MSTGYYANDSISFLNLRFENDVNRYGTQTSEYTDEELVEFENDVNRYGTQTQNKTNKAINRFENDVNRYGTQTALW